MRTETADILASSSWDREEATTLKLFFWNWFNRKDEKHPVMDIIGCFFMGEYQRKPLALLSLSRRSSTAGSVFSGLAVKSEDGNGGSAILFGFFAFSDGQNFWFRRICHIEEFFSAFRRIFAPYLWEIWTKKENILSNHYMLKFYWHYVNELLQKS